MLCTVCNVDKITLFYFKKTSPTCGACYLEDRRNKFGVYSYGGNRQKALERDNYTCQLCGKKPLGRELQIHHIDGKGSGVPLNQQNNNLENLITLCRQCHRKEDTKIGLSGGNKKGWNPLKGRWSWLFDKCIECGKIDSKHSTKGICNRCFSKTRTEYKKIKQREYYIKWRLQKNSGLLNLKD